ncbi:MAG TPA: NAD(P)H-dependent oxidoreductase subunit E [Candidatus Tumulicola sp.]|jgi:NADH-quinone oxidoreductase subunit F
MDLHFTASVETDVERSAIDGVLGAAGGWSGGHDARERRHLLLPVLHAIAERVGWISAGALNYACRRLAVAPADAYGVATFYAMFSTAPRAPGVLHVCDDIACLNAGSETIARRLGDVFGPAGEPAADGRVTWLRSPCLGLCDRAPAALLTVAGDEPVARQIAPLDADAAVAHLQTGNAPASAAAPHVGGAPLRLLRRIGRVDPESLDDYRRHDGYRALERAFELGAPGVVKETLASKLLGRGGAAFPTGRKMQSVAGAPARPHYLVCNADESEPGTFKDRILMEHDPFAVIEAMTIAGFAAGCERGFIYLRGEYPLAARRLAGAIAEARAGGLLGDSVMKRGFAFDVEIRRGAGAYICGEETALFNSIEGKRGEPRSKPPFPVEVGLFGRPTIVNNVETLANLPWIVLEGGAAYARLGTPDSTGTRLFCVSGAVPQPGLYEVEHGTTLGTLLRLAGGIAPESIATILLGGAAGSFVSADALALPLSFEGARAAGATLGSGVVMVFDAKADLRAVLLRIAQFFREESCGQCVPCRVGTVRQEEALRRLVGAGGSARTASDLTLLDEIGRAMRDASICGLGQTAANAIASASKDLEAFFASGAP